MKTKKTTKKKRTPSPKVLLRKELKALNAKFKDLALGEFMTALRAEIIDESQGEIEMTKDEKILRRAILKLAADHIVDTFGEPLKDIDLPDSLDNNDMDRIVAGVRKEILALRNVKTP